VVTGFGTKRKEISRTTANRERISFPKTVPADGWPAYQSYLEVSKQAINPDSTLKGNETISSLSIKKVPYLPLKGNSPSPMPGFSL